MNLPAKSEVSNCKNVGVYVVTYYKSSEFLRLRTNLVSPW